MSLRTFVGTAIIAVGVSLGSSGFAQQVKLLEQKPDPHGFPRPARDARDVPLKTSLYFEVGFAAQDKKGDTILPDSITIRLQARGSDPIDVLNAGSKFATGYSGWIRPRSNLQGEISVAVYVDSDAALRPSTTYTVHVAAASRQGQKLSPREGEWSFTTEAAPRTQSVPFVVDTNSDPILWHGGFFTGFVNVIFCTSKDTFGDTYELMARARKDHPKAWSLQRDFWMTGSEQERQFLPVNLPNIIRERETRRIAAIEPRGNSTLLRVEDVYGSRQYGADANRPLDEDWHAGDEVIVSDSAHDARSQVASVDAKAGTVLVRALKTPPGGWKIAYSAPVPVREDPDAPGLFPSGGCYLRKFKPVGTPVYYWGRLDKEWDLAHTRYGRRLVPNFADSSPDLAPDGRTWTTAKDYAQWHEVVRLLTGHIIDRYGKDSLEFVWSVFNEPDLGPLFWRTNWNELQNFYDYTTDAILRAFEDRGYDSRKVFIGGLELGGIFGPNLRVKEFLTHCSPTAQGPGATPKNAAVADSRLDGKRSKRVEELCKSHGGKGTPCDFISIHSYNRSEIMAAKLIRAKEEALAIDADFYRDLWVNSHESCPEWAPPPDLAAGDSYLGNGYFPTWCADVVRRQLGKAAQDRRYAFGETILTVWPPNQNFGGSNAVTRRIHCDDNGDGRADRVVTIPMPIFHALNLLSDMGSRYWVLPDRHVGGHIVSGFASRDERAVRVLLYSHHSEDTQSRSEADFKVDLQIRSLKGRRVRVKEYRFDKYNNSYYRLGRALRDRPAAEQRPAPPGAVDSANRDLENADPAIQRKGLDALAALGAAALPALPKIAKLLNESKDEAVRAKAQAIAVAMMGPAAYSKRDVEKVEALAELRATGTSSQPVDAEGRLHLSPIVAGNGANFLVIEPEEANP